MADKGAVAVAERNALRSACIGSGNIHSKIADTIDQTLWQDTLIATAAVKTLNATPVTVVTAPGAGKYVEFISAVVFMDYATTQYVAGAGEDLQFFVTDETGDPVSQKADGAIFADAADRVVSLGRTETAVADTVNELVANASIVAHVLTGEWATGDSPLKIRVFYKIHTLTGDLEDIA